MRADSGDQPQERSERDRTRPGAGVPRSLPRGTRAAQTAGSGNSRSGRRSPASGGPHPRWVGPGGRQAPPRATHRAAGDRERRTPGGRLQTPLRLLQTRLESPRRSPYGSPERTDSLRGLIRTLSLIGDPNIGVLFLPLLDHREAEIRELAAEQLSRVASRLSPESLVRYLEDPNERVRSAIVRCLGKQIGAEVMPPLMERMLDPSASVRQEVAAAFGRATDLEDEQPVQLLTKMAKDRSVLVRAQVAGVPHPPWCGRGSVRSSRRPVGIWMRPTSWPSAPG